MSDSVYILAFSTANYDAMKKFFADLGFAIDETRSQLAPLFESGRAAYVRRGELNFNLEESSAPGRKADFNLMLCDYDDAEIARVKALGYPYEYGESLYGETHTFRSPDGGIIVIT
ncbi:MAG TPA: hypothetical protein VGH19_21960 [Verrucomicrobiae bacterium]